VQQIRRKSDKKLDAAPQKSVISRHEPIQAQKSTTLKIVIPKHNDPIATKKSSPDD